MKEIRVYVVNVNYSLFDNSATDEEFITEAESLGTVYSLKGFQDAFNNEDISSITDIIRII